MLIDSPPYVIPECLQIQYDVPEVVDIKSPQNIVQVEVLTRDASLPPDETLAVKFQLIWLLACRAREIGQVVYQVLQEVLREVRVVFDGTVFVCEEQVAFTVERVVADGDITLVGLGTAGYILVLNILLFAKVILLGLNIVELILRLKILSKEFESRQVLRVLDPSFRLRQWKALMRYLRVIVRLTLHVIIAFSQHLSVKRVPVSRVRIQLSLLHLQHSLEILIVKGEILLVLLE